ncbi:hypothetical protein IL306_004266, partial [Fusarium sp. DS 682]
QDQKVENIGCGLAIFEEFGEEDGCSDLTGFSELLLRYNSKVRDVAEHVQDSDDGK